MDCDYLFDFESIKDAFSQVKVSDNKNYGQYSAKIRMYDSRLKSFRRVQRSSILADLVDLALALNLADRLAIQRQSHALNIQVTLPVRNPELLNEPSIKNSLKKLLYWYTGDNWTFIFKKRGESGRTSETQLCMPLAFAADIASTEVALWSGGLDSLAGLYKRFLQNPQTNFVLIGTGSSDILTGRQKQVLKMLRGNAQIDGKFNLIRVPLRMTYPKRLSTNKNYRVRGLVFLLVGAVCAMLEGQNQLYVYENGIGAINLPYTKAETGQDHSKAVHPLSLIRAGNFISSLTDQPFKIVNPFVFETKAQMCTVLKNMPEVVSETVSCDHLHRTIPNHSQCGFCTSCLLRRQSLIAAGISDQTQYLVSDGRAITSEDKYPLQHMLKQVDDLIPILSSVDPWYKLCKKYPDDFPELLDEMSSEQKLSENELKDCVIRLYRTYVQEWQDIKTSIKHQLEYTKEQLKTSEEKVQCQQIPLIRSTLVN